MQLLQQEADQKIKEKEQAIIHEQNRVKDQERATNALKNVATKQIVAATEETKAAKKVIAQKNTIIKFEHEK